MTTLSHSGNSLVSIFWSSSLNMFNRGSIETSCTDLKSSSRAMEWLFSSEKMADSSWNRSLLSESTSAHTLLSRYTGFDCSPEIIAFNDEKFLSNRSSCDEAKTEQAVKMRASGCHSFPWRGTNTRLRTSRCSEELFTRGQHAHTKSAPRPVPCSVASSAQMLWPWLDPLHALT